MPKYVVMNEHTLGYLIKGTVSMGILHASVLRGSPFDRLTGTVFISRLDNIRPATEKDFEEYRVCLPPDFK